MDTNIPASMESVDESMALLRELERLNMADRGVGDEQEQQQTSPPGQQLQVRDDQVRNNAGGFVFQVSDLTRARRFLILGTDGGTYYVREKELTLENLEALIEIIRKGKGGMLLREIVAISLAGRAPKQNPLLFALALCARYEVKDFKKLSSKWMTIGPQTKPNDVKQTEEEKKFDQYMHQLHQSALKAVSKVCRIPTHLFAFVKYCELVSKSTGSSTNSTGWGRSMRKCVTEWYLQKPAKELAMHMTKYPNREGWTHRDVLRLAHPMASRKRELTLVYDQMFHHACNGEFDEHKAKIPEISGNEKDDGDGGPVMKRARCDYVVTEQMVKHADESEALALIQRVKEVGKLKKDEAGEQRCAELIRGYGLVREHIPTELLNSKIVWAALLEQMPMTALLRNLSKLATLGMLKDPENSKYVDMVLEKLRNQQAIHKARLHPIAVLLAASVYKQGRGVKGKLTWESNERVVAALDDCFLAAFKNVRPTGKRFCLALDVSGSMESECIGGAALSCCEASAAMANVFLRTEENVECVGFESKLTVLPFTKETTMTQMVEHVAGLRFGNTDCALPMLWAAEAKKPFDVFIVCTDSETWFGDVHPFEALKRYRKEMDIPEAKLIVMGMTSTEFSIADPSDPGMLDICGLDYAVPELVRSFVLNEL